MLVATAGHQTASYSTALHSKASTSSSSSNNSNNNATDSANTTRICRDTLAAASTTLKESNASQGLAQTNNSGSVSVSGTSITNGLLKNLSVRIGRGTEFIRDTVHRALVNTTTSSSSSSATSATNFFYTTTTTTTTSTNNSSSNSSANVVAKSASKVNGPLSTLPSSSAAAAAASASGVAATSSSSAVSAGDAKSQRHHALTRNPTADFLRLYTVAPTYLHKYPERECSNVTDCIHKEHMCHFKPIRPAPTTQPKISSRSRGAGMKNPKAQLPPRVKVDFMQNPSLCADLLGKSSSAQTLSNAVDDPDAIQEQQQQHDNSDNHQGDDIIVYEHLKPKPTTTTLPTIYTPPQHPSAFVYLMPHMRDITNAPNTFEKSANMADTKAKAPKAKKPRIVRKVPTTTTTIAFGTATTTAITKKPRKATTKNVYVGRTHVAMMRTAKRASMPIKAPPKPYKEVARMSTSNKSSMSIEAPQKSFKPVARMRTSNMCRTLTSTAANKKKTTTATKTTAAVATATSAGRIARKKQTNALVADKKANTTTTTSKPKRANAAAVKKPTTAAAAADKAPVVDLRKIMERSGAVVPRRTRSQLVQEEHDLQMRAKRLAANEQRRQRNTAIDVTSSSSSSTTLQQIMHVHRSRNVDTLKVPKARAAGGAASATATSAAKKTKAPNDMTNEVANKRARLETNAESTAAPKAGTTLGAPATAIKSKRGRPRKLAAPQPNIGDGVAPKRTGVEGRSPILTRSRRLRLPLLNAN